MSEEETTEAASLGIEEPDRWVKERLRWLKHEDWMEEVEAECQEQLDCSLADLPKLDYWDKWYMGLSPKEVIEYVICLESMDHIILRRE